MDDPGVDGLLEWIHGVVEARWGKFWAWTIYFGLLASLIVIAIWLVTRFGRT
jgi:Na+/melibiose symporter-like transporter